MNGLRPARSYACFQLTIGERIPDDAYPLTAKYTPATEMANLPATADGSLTLDLNEAKLATLIQRVSDGPINQMYEKFASNCRKLGRRFHSTCFTGNANKPIRDLLKRALAEADDQPLGLRFLLSVEAQDLAALPWELLAQSGGTVPFLVLRPGLSLARSPSPGVISHAIGFPASQSRLKVLMIVSNPDILPDGVATVDVMTQLRQVREALRPLGDEGNLHFACIKHAGRFPDGPLPCLTNSDDGDPDPCLWHAKPDMMLNAMCAFAPHVVHFVGHGMLRPEAGEDPAEVGRPSLLLERPAPDESNGEYEGYWVTGKQIQSFFHKTQNPRLVVINACQSAAASRSGAKRLDSVARELFDKSRVPAVIGIQYIIRQTAANALAREFYTAFAEGTPLDEALRRARQNLYERTEPDGAANDWFSPVLFLNAQEDRIFRPAGEQPVLFATQSDIAATGDILTIYGEDLIGKTQPIVQIGNAEAEVLNTQQTAVTIRIPEDAESGKIIIETSGGTAETDITIREKTELGPPPPLPHPEPAPPDPVPSPPPPPPPPSPTPVWQETESPIPTGEGPIAIVLSPDNQRAYILNHQSQDVSVIDLAGRKEQQRILLSGPSINYEKILKDETLAKRLSPSPEPLDLDLSPDGRLLYVTGRWLQVFDAQSGTLGVPVYVNRSPQALALTPDGRWGMMVDARGQVSMMDLLYHRSWGASANVGPGPWHLGILPEGRRACISSQNQVSMVNLDLLRTNGDQPMHGIDLPDQAYAPGALAFAPNGRLAYVTCLAGENEHARGALAVLNLEAGEPAATNLITTPCPKFVGLAMLPTGNQLLAVGFEEQSNRTGFYVIDLTAGTVVFSLRVGPAGIRPSALALTSDGEWACVCYTEGNCLSLISRTTSSEP